MSDNKYKEVVRLVRNYSLAHDFVEAVYLKPSKNGLRVFSVLASGDNDAFRFREDLDYFEGLVKRVSGEEICLEDIYSAPKNGDGIIYPSGDEVL